MSLRKIENPDVFRSRVVERIDDILQNTKNSKNLEKGIFNYSLKEAEYRKIIKKWDNQLFVQLYIDHLRSIMVNLKNPVILEQINDGTIKSHMVAFMTHQEMRPDRWADLIAQKIIKDKNKFETNIEAATDTFTCRKCKSKKCTYYQVQIRSADEPMTTFITCLECGNRWKQN
jgi:transcription elongation factor S-II